MWNAAFSRFGSRYILVMTLLTRLLGLIGGLLTIYYVQVTLVRLPPETGRHFQVAGLLATAAAVLVTSILAHHLSHNLRRAVRRLQQGLPLDAELGAAAYREAMTFVGRQLLREAFLVPLVTTVPVCIYLRLAVGMEVSALQHIVVATMLGIALSLMLMFFTMEQAMQPVIRYLYANGLAVDLEELPLHPLHVKMNLCFGIIIVCTVTMIGSMASRRAWDIIESPGDETLAVASLREHTLFISLAALVVGLAYSRLLARSVTHRVAHLVHVMKRVERGALSERVQPTGIDEIDLLTQQFNRMVGELEQKGRTVRDLNVNLERKVRVRTRELARSKQSLQQSLEKLRESDRHKTEFFSNISHELRTPLMMILSPIEQLTRHDGAKLDDAAQCLLNVASVNAHRLLNLINQLLDLAKLEAGHASLQRGPVDLNDLVRRLVAAATPLAEQRGLSLETRLDPAVPMLNADVEKLDAAITNLLSNAIKFTPRGGHVRLVTALEHGADETNHVRLDVRDTGIGIAPENLERLFQRFVQVDGSSSREFAGTGLGLALVREFVELHGGRVDVASEPGVGSTFSFHVPVVAADDGSAKPLTVVQEERLHRFADLVECRVPDRRKQAPIAAKHILIVDDTPEVRHLLGDMLASDYRVSFAGDGHAGWCAVQKDPPDLIISDVMMPGTDGYEFCRRVKSHAETAGIPFVLLTAQAHTSQKIAGLNDGADDYLIKPFEEEELLARVRSLLRIREMHTELSANNSSLERTLAELRRTQDQLVQSEKMSSLGQLVAGLAHEINNSINAVYNGIPTIIDRTDQLERLVAAALAETDPAMRRDVETRFGKIRTLSHVVAEGAERTARIIGDMKSFAHPGVAGTEQFDPNQSLQVCINLLGAQFHERITVLRDLQDVGTVRGHFGQLNQVLLNLLTNAVQAMPHGGEINVSTRREEDTVVITVRDSGSGISEEHRARIFDPFFTTKPPGHGTGLGLSISYGIIRRMGGTIECLSEPGNGAEFVIRLPAAESATPGAMSDSRDTFLS